VDNSYFTWRWFGPRRARQPSPFALEQPKPDDRVRIFVLGASAAQGDPDPAFSMSRFMDILLERGWPDLDTEVVNLGMTAINSHVVLPIAKASLELDPDLLVVYLGNNEVVGPFGIAEGPPTVVDRARHLVVRTRIGQLFQGMQYRSAARRGQLRTWQGMEEFLKHEVAIDDPRLEEIYRQFETNVEGVLQAAGRAGVPVVLCTVAVNLADSPPFGSAHRSDVSPDELHSWQSLIDEAWQLAAAGEMAQAFDRFDRAAAIDPQHAETVFRRGQALVALGRYAEAREAFSTARDLDTLRFRADSRINAILRELAGRDWPAPVVLADVAGTADAVSPGGISGGALLYEHVHLNPAGNDLAARTILARAMESDLVPGLAPGPRRTLPTEAEAAEALGFSGWNLYQAANEVLQRLERPPFTNRPDAEQRSQSLTAEVEKLRVFTGGEALDHAFAVAVAAHNARPDDWVLHYQLARMQLNRDPAAAEIHFRRILELRPTFNMARRMLGRLLLDQGRTDEALVELEILAHHHPWSPGSNLDYGIALLSAGQPEQAVSVLRRAFLLDSGSPDTMYHLALALLAVDEDPSPARRTEAAQLLEEALDIDPSHRDARRVLDTLRRQQ
jgi:tetratricopeptide (TPR) repeat protein